MSLGRNNRSPLIDLDRFVGFLAEGDSKKILGRAQLSPEGDRERECRCAAEIVQIETNRTR